MLPRKAQHQLEHALIESVVTIIGAVGILHPRGEARSFVVEEDATIADGWLAIGIDSLVYEDGVVMLHRHVCPSRTKAIRPSAGRVRRCRRWFLDGRCRR